MKTIEDVCNKLLEEIEESCSKASAYRKQIEKLQINKEIVEDDSCEEVIEDNNTTSLKNTDYEDELEFYLDSYLKLNENFTEEELEDILPSRKHPLFSDIINRMIAETFKEIKELEELMLEDTDEEETISEYRSIFDSENKKIEVLKNTLKKSTTTKEDPDDKENKLILVPTENGKLRVLDEIESLPNEYYDGFLELIISIKNGTFKNVKKFLHNNKLVGMSEVKGFQTRIVFTRIDKDAYALITAFIKKTDSDHFYRSGLERKVAEYRKRENKIKELLSDEEFIKENDLAVEELFNTLGYSEDVKQYNRGGIYE